MNLLKKMLTENPLYRPTATEALQHDFLINPTYNKVQDIDMIENLMNFQKEYFFFLFFMKFSIL